MRHEDGKVDGDLIVADELNMQGIVTGNITVRPSGSLTLNGMCGGNLVIEGGASAAVRGMVSGSVLNKGGQLSLDGLVIGSANCQEGETTFGPDTKVIGGISGAVILTCKNCSQRLRVPGQQSEVKVTCTKCRTSWAWEPTKMPGNNVHVSGMKDQNQEQFIQDFLRDFDIGKFVNSFASQAPAPKTDPAKPKRPWWKFW
jgi:hypothetical protein